MFHEMLLPGAAPGSTVPAWYMHHETLSTPVGDRVARHKVSLCTRGEPGITVGQRITVSGRQYIVQSIQPPPEPTAEWLIDGYRHEAVWAGEVSVWRGSSELDEDTGDEIWSKVEVARTKYAFRNADSQPMMRESHGQDDYSAAGSFWVPIDTPVKVGDWVQISGVWWKLTLFTEVAYDVADLYKVTTSYSGPPWRG